MAVVVVGIHTLPAETFLEGISCCVSAIYSLAVPFFFVTSGFFLGSKIKGSAREEQLAYLRKWLRRLGRLYILWTAIYLPYAIYGFSLEQLGFTKTLAVYVRNILLVGENYWSWPLWYLLAMFVAGCMIYLLSRFKIKQIYWYIFAIAFAIAGILLDELRANDWGWVNLYYSIFKTTRNGLFVGFPYIALGLFVSSYGIRLSKLSLLALIAIGFASQLFDVPLSNHITIYALFSLLLSINLPTRKDDLYINVRLSSSVIYFTHMLWVGLLHLFFPEILALSLFATAVLLSSLTAAAAVRYKEQGVVKLLFR